MSDMRLQMTIILVGAFGAVQKDAAQSPPTPVNRAR